MCLFTAGSDWQCRSCTGRSGWQEGHSTHTDLCYHSAFCRCGALQRAVRHHAPGHSHQQGHEVYQVPQICTPAGGTSRQWQMPGVLRVDDANMPSGQPDSGASARQTAAWKAGGAPERRSSLMAVESSEARRPLTTAMRYRAPPNTHDTTPPQWMKLMPPAMRASSRPEPQPPAPRPARPRPAAMAGAGARPAGGAGAALPGRRGPGERGGGRGWGNNGSGRPSSGGCAPQLAPPCCPARTVTDAAWWPGPGRRRAGVQYRLHGPSGSLAIESSAECHAPCVGRWGAASPRSVRPHPAAEQPRINRMALWLIGNLLWPILGALVCMNIHGNT